jgi:hypothetical protein
MAKRERIIPPKQAGGAKASGGSRESVTRGYSRRTSSRRNLFSPYAFRRTSGGHDARLAPDGVGALREDISYGSSKHFNDARYRNRRTDSCAR